MLPPFFCFLDLAAGLERSSVAALPRFPDCSDIDTLRPAGLVEWNGDDGSLREMLRDCVNRLCSEFARRMVLRGSL